MVLCEEGGLFFIDGRMKRIHINTLCFFSFTDVLQAYNCTLFSYGQVWYFGEGDWVI